MELPNKKYKIIYADPPWQYANFHTISKFQKNGKKNNTHGLAEGHYKTMTIQEICDLPIESLADENAILFLWTTWAVLEDSFKVIKSWGFKYKTIAFDWFKTNDNNDNFRYGMGSYTRANSEPCLLCTRGKPKQLIKDYSVLSAIKYPIQGHSKKPDIVRQKIVQLCGDLPRIELFARTRPHGWDVWGNDIRLQHEPLESFSRY